MPYLTRVKNGKKILVPDLIDDGRNWSNYRKKLFEAAAAQDLLGLLDGTKTKPNEPWDPWHTAAWMRDDTEAQYLVITTTPPTVHDHLSLSMTAHKFFKTLQDLFEKKSTATTTVHDAQHNDTTPVAARASDGVRNRSGRQQDNSPSDGTRRERERKTMDQDRVGPKRRVGKKGEKPRRRVEEGAVTARGPGTKTTDLQADGVGLATPASSPMAGRQVGEKTADTIHPNATSAEPTEPVDRSPGPAVEPEPPRCESYTMSHDRTPPSEDASGGEVQEVAASHKVATGDEVEGVETDDEDHRVHEPIDDERSRVETSEDETITTTISVSAPSASCDHPDEDTVTTDPGRPSRDPAGATGDDERRPDGPAEPPDKPQGEGGRDGDTRVETEVSEASRACAGGMGELSDEPRRLTKPDDSPDDSVEGAKVGEVETSVLQASRSVQEGPGDGDDEEGRPGVPDEPSSETDVEQNRGAAHEVADAVADGREEEAHPDVQVEVESVERWRDGVRARIYDRRRKSKKMVSAPHGTMKAYLEHHLSTIHHPLTQSRLRYRRTNPRTSSSRGRERYQQAATPDLPAPRRTRQEHLRMSRTTRSCRRTYGTRQNAPTSPWNREVEKTHQRELQSS